MASGRTISANFLTPLDKKVITLCKRITEVICASITASGKREDFKDKYGKISLTRDGGAGKGGGKLQRDAVCTRGRQGKAPFSNRNLRWNPLVVAATKPPFAKEIDRIEIEGSGNSQTLTFVIKIKGKDVKFPSDRVFKMPERFVALPSHWMPHIASLKLWSDMLWTQNSCVISAAEACDWWDAVETYAVLGIVAAVEFYNADIDTLHGKVTELLKGQTIEKRISLPTAAFSSDREGIAKCPLCLRRVSESLKDFRYKDTGQTWQPDWRTSKQMEGDDSSLQIMHIDPLAESEIRHRANNVRYGHRWCNVSMSDHSLDETLDFMEFVVNAHNRGG